MTMAATKNLTRSVAHAFATGTRQGGSAPPTPTRFERLEARNAENARQLAEAKEAATLANLRASALTAMVDNGVTDPLARRRGQNMVEAEREKAKREGRAFDYADAVKRAIHAAKGGKGVAPVPSKGAALHPGTRTAPATFQDVQAERERYRQWLRDHGMIDPATQSIPGDGGPFNGGPLGGR